MKHIKIKSYTLSELILVVAIIGILTLGMTAYMGNSGEKAKIIEAQGCANAIGGELKNYIYNALTSKNLKIGDNYVSPKYYNIELIGSDHGLCGPESEPDGDFCNEIRLGYITGELGITPYDTKILIIPYQILNTNNTCHKSKTKLGYYYGTGDSSTDAIMYINMNKGFTPKNVNEKKTFYFQKNTTYTDLDEFKLLIGDIKVVLCYNEECTSRKHIGKFHIDARSQTIEFQKCKFYKEEEPTRCKTREGETDDEV